MQIWHLFHCFIFIIFNAIANGIVLSFSDFSLLVYRNIIEVFILILYTTTLLSYLLISFFNLISNRLFYRFVRSMFHANKNSFILKSVFNLYFLLCCIGWNFSKMSNRSLKWTFLLLSQSQRENIQNELSVN